MDGFHKMRISDRRRGSTLGCGEKGLGAGTGGEGIGWAVELAVEGGEEFPSCGILRFDLGGAFGVTDRFGVLIESGVGGGKIKPGAGVIRSEAGGGLGDGNGEGEFVAGI